MSWHYLQEQEEASWEASCLDGAPSALLRLIPTADASSSRGSAMDACHDSQSGTTCGRSTESHGADTSMLSAEDSHARTLALPEKAQASTASAAGCGGSSHESLATLDRATYSWRTRQLSLIGGGAELLETLPRWGMTRDGELSELATLVRRITGIESGLWPTPTSHNAKECNAPSESNRNTPTLAAQVGGTLNPPWVEWLMGWPIGWTDLEPLATGKFQLWLRSHGGF